MPSYPSFNFPLPFERPKLKTFMTSYKKIVYCVHFLWLVVHLFNQSPSYLALGILLH